MRFLPVPVEQPRVAPAPLLMSNAPSASTLVHAGSAGLPRLSPPDPKPLEPVRVTRWPWVVGGAVIGAVAGLVASHLLAPQVHRARAHVELTAGDLPTLRSKLSAAAALVGSPTLLSKLDLSAMPDLKAHSGRAPFEAQLVNEAAMLEISHEGDDPTRAAQLVDMMARVVADYLTPVEPTTTAPDEGDPALDVEAQITALRRQLAALRRSDPDLASTVERLDRREQELRVRLDVARTLEQEQSARVEAQRVAINRLHTMLDVPDNPLEQDDPILKAALQEQSEALKQYWQHLEASRTTDHPDVRALQIKIDQTRKSIAQRRVELLERASQDSTSPLQARKIEIIEMESELIARTLSRMNLESEFQTVSQERALARQRLADVSADEQTRSRIEAEIVSLQSSAQAPTIVAPEPDAWQVRVHESGLAESRTLGADWLPATLASSLLASILMFAGVGVFERRRRTLTTGDFARVLGAPVLVKIPDGRSVRRGQSLPATGATADALALLRARLLQATSGRPCTVVGVQSLGPGDGATGVAVGLASLLGRTGRQTLMIDANVVSPALAERFAVEPVPGWTDLFRSPAKLRQLLHPDVTEGVDLLTIGSWAERASDLLASPGFSRLISHATRRYGVIVLDLPPVLTSFEVDIVQRLLDATILCVRASADARNLYRVGTRLRDCGAPVLGVVITRASRV